MQDSIHAMAHNALPPPDDSHIVQAEWNLADDEAFEDLDDGIVTNTKERWGHDALPSRKREREALGDPGPQEACFGCIYDWDGKGAAMRDEHIAEMRAIARKGIVKACPQSVAREIARHHARLRREINRDRGDRAPIPGWDAASILHHLRYHNVDPEIQTALRLYEIQEVLCKAYDAIIEVSDKTGEVRINEKQAAIVERYIKLWYFVSRQKAKDLSFYNPGAHIDTNVASQSVVTTERKEIVNWFKRQRRGE